jgi:hypothetical protein
MDNKHINTIDNSVVDSVRKVIVDKSIQDSLIQYLILVEDESDGFATPDIDFTTKKNDTISILLLDSEKKFKKALFNRYLIKGHYRVYFKSAINLLNEYLNNEKIYYLLIVSSEAHELQKGLLIK